MHTDFCVVEVVFIPRILCCLAEVFIYIQGVLFDWTPPK